MTQQDGTITHFPIHKNREIGEIRVKFATGSAWAKISSKVSFNRSIPHLQKPNANILEAKQLDSQACNINALLAIFRPFFLLSGRLIGNFISNHSRVLHESSGWCRLTLDDGFTNISYMYIILKNPLFSKFRSP